MARSLLPHGFVSWVLNNSGWDIGRLGARALYGICTPVSPANAKPGDLIFFHSTYKTETPGISHVGLYVGDGFMLHCGDPIGYADITTNYWQSHFYGFGKLY
jgi:cell wall-associated NlpC family hydrolase